MVGKNLKLPLLKEKTWYHKKTQGFIVSKKNSLEIDDIDDFKLASFYMKKFKYE